MPSVKGDDVESARRFAIRSFGRGFLGALGAVASMTSGLGCSGADDAHRSRPVDAYHMGCTQTDAAHSVSCPCATTDDLRRIPDGSFLERISITPMGGIDFEPLGRLTHLHALVIDADGPVDLRGLETVQGIRELTVASRSVDWHPIGKMPFIDKLVLFDTGHGPRDKTIDLGFVADLTGLRILDISHIQVSDLSWLAHLEKLERLKLRCASCSTPEGIAQYRAENPALGFRESHGTAVDYGLAGPSGDICEVDPKSCPRHDDCR